MHKVYLYQFISEHGGWENCTYKIMETPFVVSNEKEGKLRWRHIEKLSASLNDYTPTRSEKNRCYLHKDLIMQQHRAWFEKRTKVYARRRKTHASNKQATEDPLMLATAG